MMDESRRKIKMKQITIDNIKLKKIGDSYYALIPSDYIKHSGIDINKKLKLILEI